MERGDPAGDREMLPSWLGSHNVHICLELIASLSFEKFRPHQKRTTSTRPKLAQGLTFAGIVSRRPDDNQRRRACASQFSDCLPAFVARDYRFER